MDDLLGQFASQSNGGDLSARGMVPSCDVSETEDAVEIHLDAPGFQADQIDIQVNHNSVTIRGERKEEKEEKDRTYHRVERRSGSFSRIISLPCSIQEDKVDAEFQDGVLTTSLPKAEEAKTRKVEIKADK